MKKKISIGQYNTLYAIAEEGLQQSWSDLGIPLDCKVLDEMIKNNKDIQEKAKTSSLPANYFLYKKNANNIIDQILKELKISVADS